MLTVEQYVTEFLQFVVMPWCLWVSTALMKQKHDLNAAFKKIRTLEGLDATDCD
jgi:hypothetical protein